MITTALMDGDLLINKACFACERRWYEIELDNGHILRTEGRTGKKDALKYIEENKENVINFSLKRDSTPLGIVKKTVDNMIKGIMEETKCIDYLIIVGESGAVLNRHKIATHQTYKGNRKDENRPLYGEKIKQYLISEHSAKVAQDGLETDDVLGIMQDDTSLITPIEKDFLMIPGTLYDYDKKEYIHISDPGTLTLSKRNDGKRWELKGTGFKWFCAQMLLGDAVDNIPKPKKGLGDKKVFELLDYCTTKQEMWNEISCVYEDSELILEENADLLWILRDKDKTWRDEL